MEKYLIEHCSPTLAGIKCGNIFTLRRHCVCDMNIYKKIDSLNEELNEKNVFAHILCENKETIIVYIYRKNKLCEKLLKSSVQSILKDKSYDFSMFNSNYDLTDILNQLSSRFNGMPEFPHEIGIFLDYPESDVLSFIENKGKNCLCSDAWKIYSDVDSAKKICRNYRICKHAYKMSFLNGKTIKQLTVAV